MVTPNIRNILKERKQLLSHLFTVERLDKDDLDHFVDKDNQPISRYLVYCTDIVTLTEAREMVEDEGSDNVIGVDYGKFLLKGTYNNIEKGPLGKSKLDRGVKYCQVLFCVSKVPESYHNLTVIEKKLQINSIDCKISTDLKCMNLMLGLQSHSAKFPCPYGHCCKITRAGLETARKQHLVLREDEDEGSWWKGDDRTLESLSFYQEKYDQQQNKTRSSLMNFYNCEFQPLLHPRPSAVSPTPVLQKMPPPPLHCIRLGPTNFLLKELRVLWPELQDYLDNLHVELDDYHGGAFEGNECKKILKNISNLHIPCEFEDFKEALMALRDLDLMASNPDLPKDYKETIQAWRCSWRRLFRSRKITCPNKIHIINHHLEVIQVLTGLVFHYSIIQ